ncbi:cytochrome P450 [Streptomyces sp. NPDC020792]|uniref:cytochrome P450 n=1 Tax=Streptomyces sp. NPDC020792 TaxID=3365089 RepID=UPI0037A21384
MSTTVASEAQGKSVPYLDDDPFSSEVLENPLPFQGRLREAGPVAFLSRYNVYAVGRYDEVHQALLNWQDLTSGSGVGLNKPWRTQGLLHTDPPRHDAGREVLSSILSARAVRTLKEDCKRYAESLVDDLLAGHAANGELEVDGYKDIASVFPLRFFSDAAGIGDAGRENLLPYADHVFNNLGPRNDLVIQGETRFPERSEWATRQCSRDSLKPQSFGSEIWAAADRGDIMHDQAPLLTRSLLSAGLDTTVYGLSAMLHAFATNPDQWAVLRDNPNLARVAFDEAIRWESPFQMVFRKASKDVTISGTVIPEGMKLLLCFAAANRDPRRWDNPDRFDLSRDPSGHVAFGMGIHQCVGQHVARLEAEALLQVLLGRVKHMKLAAPVSRRHNNTLRGWGAIPLRMRLS